DEDDYAVTPSEYSNRGRRTVFIKRHKGAVPDRWILDLFLSHMTGPEIAKRCHIHPHTAGDKIKELLDAGIITEQQRRERRSAIAARKNKNRSRMMRGPEDKRSNMVLYRCVIKHYRKSSNTRETARAIGVSNATVSRYVRFHNQQRKVEEVA
ncbi:unnamed protein product, partial [marine sediment metagenome]